MNEQESQVKAVLDAYAAAVCARNVDAFVELYDADVHIFDAWGQWELRGAGAWREMVTDWFGAHEDERDVVEINEVEIVAAEDVAWTHATITFAWESAAGERLRTMTNRATMCLAKEDGAWKIVHEHTSLPIDMETMTAIRER